MKGIANLMKGIRDLDDEVRNLIKGIADLVKGIGNLDDEVANLMKGIGNLDDEVINLVKGIANLMKGIRNLDDEVSLPRERHHPCEYPGNLTDLSSAWVEGQAFARRGSRVRPLPCLRVRMCRTPMGRGSGLCHAYESRMCRGGRCVLGGRPLGFAGSHRTAEDVSIPRKYRAISIQYVESRFHRREAEA